MSRYATRTVVKVERRLWDVEKMDFVSHTFEIAFNANAIPSKVYSDALKSKNGVASRVYKAIIVRETP